MIKEKLSAVRKILEEITQDGDIYKEEYSWAYNIVSQLYDHCRREDEQDTDTTI